MDEDSGEMDTNEAAKLIGIPPKKLRGYLRSDPDNLGVVQQGGRWIFTARDVARLRQVLNPKVEVQATKEKVGGELTPYQLKVLSRKDARINREVTKRYIERVNRLEAGLRRAGLHISQQEES